MAVFSLSSDVHKQNICSGLTSLQQNGEFVDMTLAADGHLVMVHQIMIALSSPYLKELITSAPCPHPVIFLNKISYSTLCSLLEYIYAGEVLVRNDEVNEVLEAARELRICGLDDAKLEVSDPSQRPLETGHKLSSNDYQTEYLDPVNGELKIVRQDDDDSFNMTDTMQHDSDTDTGMTPTPSKPPQVQTRSVLIKDASKLPQIQYTLSNHGGLQVILNRYLYSHCYTSKKGPNEGYRRWTCVNNRTGCKAHAITQGDMVIKRLGVHNHPFHDARILKKVRDGLVFATIKQAESKGADQKAEAESYNAKARSDKTDVRSAKTEVTRQKLEEMKAKTQRGASLPMI